MDSEVLGKASMELTQNTIIEARRAILELNNLVQSYCSYETFQKLMDAERAIYTEHPEIHSPHFVPQL